MMREKKKGLDKISNPDFLNTILYLFVEYYFC